MNQNFFLNGLKTIRNTAALKQGVIEVKDVLEAFPGAELEDQQIALIYAYLEQENITLADYEVHDVNTLYLEGDPEQEEESEREQQILAMYEEDLALIPPLSTEEAEDLKGRLVQGETAARQKAAERLTEGNLRWVLQIARDYMGRGVPFSDLIQEGNLALWESIRGYQGEEDLDDFLEESVRKAMEELTRESLRAGQKAREMTLAANRLLEQIQVMEEELGRELTPAELSAKTGIPEERVEAVLRESAKAIRKEERN